MTALEHGELRRMAEHGDLRRMAELFRTRGGRIEGKYGRLRWVQVINVMEAFEQCALELEDYLETLAKPSAKPAPPEAALCAAGPVETTNPS